MKIEELKGCFDSITPTQEQRDKIFAGVMKAKETPVKVVKLNRYKYLSVAAVIAIGIFVAIYSNVGNDVVPQVEVPQNNEKNLALICRVSDVPDVPLDNTDEAENEDIGNSDIVVADEAEDVSLSEELNKAYPELEENVENAPSVAMYDTEEEVYDTAIPEESDEYYNMAEGRASGGGGGGGASGGGSSANVAKPTTFTLEQITNHHIYGNLFPQNFADDFAFCDASENNDWLVANFKNDDGRYMMISIVKTGKSGISPFVVLPEDLKTMTLDGYVEFAVKCDNYYVMYCIETTDSNGVYEMVTSSVYYK